MVSTKTYVAGTAIAGMVGGIATDRALVDTPYRQARREGRLPADRKQIWDLPGSGANLLELAAPIALTTAGLSALHIHGAALPVDRVWHRRPAGAAMLVLIASSAAFGIGAAASKYVVD